MQLLYKKQLPLTMSGMYLPGLDCLAEEGQIHYMNRWNPDYK